MADNHLGVATGCSGTLNVTAALTTGGGGGLYVARTDSGAILEGLTDSSYILEGLAIVSVQAADKIFLAVYIALWNTLANLLTQPNFRGKYLSYSDNNVGVSDSS